MAIEFDDRAINIIGNNVRAFNFLNDDRSLAASIFIDNQGRLNVGNLLIDVSHGSGGSDGSGSGAVHHHELLGLQDDDHQQYVHRTISRQITARHTFDPPAPAAPFILGANAQDQIVFGLRADSLNKEVLAGNGLTGGGILTSDVTVTLGTPTTLTYATLDAVTATSHAHAITTSADPGPNEVILQSNAAGGLRLRELALASSNDPQLQIENGAHTADLYLDGTGRLLLRASQNLELNPVGDVTLNPAGLDVLPGQKYAVNLGSLQNKYLTLHAAELWVETLVAQDTIATIGGRILVGPTTMLIADLAAGSATIDVEHNQMASGDRVYMEANGKVEFMAITSGPAAITGGFRYSVTRNLDGSGANEWYAGDAVFNTGTTGDGFIDLYSLQGVLSSGVGPTIVGNVRTGTAYNAWREHWAIGNLNGVYGYGANDVYGAAFGHYNSGNWLSIDSANGIRFFDGNNTLRAQLSSTTWTLGDSSNENIQITSTQIQLRNGGTVYGSLTNSTWELGQIANNRTRVNITTTSGIRFIHRSGSGVESTVLQFATDGSGTLSGTLDVAGQLTAAGSVFVNTDGLSIGIGTGLKNRLTWTTGLANIAHIYVNPSDSNNLYVDSLSDNLVLKANFTSVTGALLVGSLVDATNSIRTGGGLVVGSTALNAGAGDALYLGNLIARRSNVSFTGYIFIPATSPYTSTSWDGDAKNASGGTTIDLPSQFGVPQNVRAVAAKLTILDTVAGRSAAIGPSAGNGAVQAISSAGTYVSSSGIVPCVSNGDIVFFSNGQLDEVWIQIYGYFI